jgi:acyl transferase domain-containing protein/acyl carrier protein
MSNNISRRIANMSPVKLALAAEQMRSKVAGIELLNVEPIAIIGMACRFPGGVRNTESFWQLLRNGVDAVTEVPPDRWDVDAYYDPDPDAPGKMNTKWGGFIDEVDQFDAHFFNISPREAARMDPQQRLLLEVTWEALESAGQGLEKLSGSPTGVFVGICGYDYSFLQFQSGKGTDPYYITGNIFSAAAGRLSYVLGIQGPCMAIDTACSSSLVTAHLACKSLRSAECDMALAAGVNLVLSADGTANFSRARMMAADGRCKTFDASADGYVRGEGCGVIVLKRLSDALAAGDPILALIRGSAINHDGRSSGFTVPNGIAQQALIREALDNAGVEAEQVSYIEAHGTGTPIGDPIEIRALGEVFGKGRNPEQRLLIGSAKTNIGHLESAAGVAGLIKLTLALQHKEIPPHLHLKEVNPYISLDDACASIPTELTPWPEINGRRIAGINSFGVSGTNAHVVLEEAPAPEATAATSQAQADVAYVLPISARSEGALRELAAAYVPLLQATTDDNALRDLCYTATLRRSHHAHRLAATGANGPAIAQRLEMWRESGPLTGVAQGRQGAAGPPKLVFVFSGQGAQWLGMGRQLLDQEPVFRQTLEQCDELLRKYVDWSLLEELQADEVHSQLTRTEVAQPVVFALQVALAALWRSWGVQPAAVVGHSMGEVAAAHVAGLLTLPEAVRVIAQRGQVMRDRAGTGRMLAVELSEVDAQKLIVDFGDRLSLAAVNSPQSCVLAGEAEALAELAEQLKQSGVACRDLGVPYPFHSAQMAGLEPELTQVLGALELQSPLLEIASTVTGQMLNSEAEAGLPLSQRSFGPAYWGQSIRQRVLFRQAVTLLAQRGYEVFVEVGPHPVLGKALQEVLAETAAPSAAGAERSAPLVVASLRRERPERVDMLHSLAQLYCVGQPVNWSVFYPGGGRCVTLPTYPWQRQRHWFSMLDEQLESLPEARQSSSGHPLLGPHLRLATDARTHLWEMELGVDLQPYLGDHRLQDLAVVPATAYVEMALAAAREAFGPGTHLLEQLSFKKLIALPDKGWQRVQLTMAPDLDGRLGFQIHSQEWSANPTTNGNANWTLHVSGRLRPASSVTTDHEAPATESLAEIQARCQVSQTSEEHYQILSQRGLQYGPTFQGVTEIWMGVGEAIGRLVAPPAVAAQGGRYQLHPALLDACFQVMAPATTSASSQLRLDESSAYLPSEIGAVRCWAQPGNEVWAHARMRLPDAADSSSANNGTGDEGPAESLLCDLALFHDNGELVAEIRGLVAKRLPRQEASRAESEMLQQWLYQPGWLSQPLPEPVSATELEPTNGTEPAAVNQATKETPGTWVIFADRRGVADHLQQQLQQRGQECLLIYPGPEFLASGQAFAPNSFLLNPDNPDDFRKLFTLLQVPHLPPCRGIVHLWSLADTTETTTLASLQQEHQRLCAGLLHLAQALAEHDDLQPRLWLVTENAQAAEATQPVSLHQAPLLGMARVIANEHPQWRCSRVDISESSDESAALFAELWSDTDEDEVALRGETRYVARLSHSATATVDSPAAAPVLTPAEGRAFRLQVGIPGILDSLLLHPCERPEPGPGEVELEVVAAGLNFLDVLSAMGIRPDQPAGEIRFGVECAGRVSAVGPGVEEWRIGDEVLTATSAAFASHVLTPTEALVRKPPQLSFEQAAGLPIVFMTAHYALNHQARLSAGERVLIHAASGGVGLAAIQLAQLAGAEVWATAGSPRKREFLQQLGVKHVMDSRSLDYAEQILQATDGAGVDVVLNSLSGEAIARNLEVLAPYGRFLEIGKRDIYSNSPLGLWPFQKNLSYFAIDLWRIFGERPLLCTRLLTEVLQMFADDRLQPLPVESFSISEAADAFRHMAQAKHIGKVVLRVKDEPVMLAAPTAATPSIADSVSADGCYLISGGMGGLGLEVAHWLVARGARQLVLVSRSGPQTEAHTAALARLQQAGAQVLTPAVDVGDPEALQQVLAQLQPPNWGPLRGIVHAAGVLDDGILLRLDASRFQPVLRPKVAGAWNLHLQTLDAPLDFFVMFSSAASLLGNAGQANYAAANAFLDSLAHHRRSLDRPALSINWGPWADVGMAANLKTSFLSTIKPQRGLAVLERLLAEATQGQVGVIPFKFNEWCQLLPSSAQTSLLKDLLKEEVTDAPAAPTSRLRAELEQLEPGPERRARLEQHLQQQLGQVLGLPPSEVDILTPLNTMGLDSLMALELSKRLEKSLGTALPATLVWNYPTIAALTPHLASKIGILLEPPAESKADVEEEEKKAAIADIQQLSDAEAEALLVEELEALKNKGSQDEQQLGA